MIGRLPRTKPIVPETERDRLLIDAMRREEALETERLRREIRDSELRLLEQVEMEGIHVLSGKVDDVAVGVRPRREVVRCHSERMQCLKCMREHGQSPTECTSVVNQLLECVRGSSG
uniref:Uncharacterized protein n=1 Tax=Compsopogon caeruleus TaxID=31354 RepID=A0A7S1XHB8_9RHOD|mmetsp:Transcript_8610/g.17457  ORF Transcript_8610/g.17457 Transcript_8610/m.17457 type:complete len:117 (+) Transcript_8610:262-612(+)